MNGMDGHMGGEGARTHSRIGYMRAIASKSRVGRIRRAVKRCFILSGDTISIGDVLRRAYPRLKRFTSWHYLAARRALRKEATIVGRKRFGRGRSALWAKRDMTAT